MPSPYDSSPAGSFVNAYTSKWSGHYNYYTDALGLPRTAAIAAATAVSEEMRNVYSEARSAASAGIANYAALPS